MKKDIHPKVYKNVAVTCACGNTFASISTTKTIQVDICSTCHPLYTGKQKFIDTEGRIDKFKKKVKLSEQKAATSKKKKADKQNSKDQQKTLKEMLQDATK